MRFRWIGSIHSTFRGGTNKAQSDPLDWGFPGPTNRFVQGWSQAKRTQCRSVSSVWGGWAGTSLAAF